MRKLLQFAVFLLAIAGVGLEPAIAGTTYAKPAVRDAWADSAASGDITDPGNSFVAAGWLSSTTPPARQYWNWALNYPSEGVRYLMQRGVVDWDTLETYAVGAVVRYTDGNLYQSLSASNIGNIPASGSAYWGPLTTITPTAGDNTGNVATTAFVHSAIAPLAPLASPALTGTPPAPPASPGTHPPQLATTAFVQNTVTSGALGFTPVQQGGGTGQGTNKLYIGWLSGSVLGLQVDTTNFAQNWPINVSGTAANITGTYGGSLTSAQVTGGLGFTPYNSSNPSGYISGINSAMVTGALGYTPPQPNGTGASGTWGISISGNAATATSASSASAVPWSGVSGHPTTVAGYGITDFASSNAQNGYIKLPGGLIMEWGYVASTGTSPQSATFPLAFPNGVYSITVTPTGAAPESWVIASGPSLVSFSVISGSGLAFYWHAIGH